MTSKKAVAPQSTAS
ncbi:hypothetical protein D039_0251A, partial [Vibrio parahaemolyticus EKP-028]